jgi:hypothetical protein
MRHSASCSRTLRVLTCALALATATTAGARVLLTQEQALRLAFGDAKVERQARFLTDAQLTRARTLAGVPVESALVTRYAATREGRPAGVAYFDTHVVRTLPETVMIVVDPEGKIARIEILSFGEPEEYLPRARWLEQFPGRGLDGELAIRKGVHGITGATLSAQAVTDASRRVLAVHRVLSDAPPPKKENAR